MTLFCTLAYVFEGGLFRNENIKPFVQELVDGSLGEFMMSEPVPQPGDTTYRKVQKVGVAARGRERLKMPKSDKMAKNSLFS